jgi:hypothetical protein
MSIIIQLKFFTFLQMLTDRRLHEITESNSNGMKFDKKTIKAIVQHQPLRLFVFELFEWQFKIIASTFNASCPGTKQCKLVGNLK